MVTTRSIRRERWNLILDAVIGAFRETGEPVSSGYLAENCGLDLSPATIRAVMKELEDEGYLSQPHTSAGRVPTVKGYRYYVHYLMPEPELAEAEAAHIRSLVEHVIRENDASLFMDHIARVISEVTDLVGVAMTPLFNRSVFDRLDIVNLGGARLLLVISLRNGIVRTINLTLNRVIARAAVDKTARLLSGRLSGLTIGEIKLTIGDRVRSLSGGDRSLVDVILEKREQIFTAPGEHSLHIAGLSHLLELPEFSEPGASHRLIDLSENHARIGGAIRQTISGDTGFTIDIGNPELLGDAPPLSVVAATCFSGRTPGILGVIGPARINYARMMAVIRHAAALTDQLFLS